MQDTEFETFTKSVARPISHQTKEEGDTLAFAARDVSGLLTPYRFSRRATGPRDVRVQVLYCGICHSDLHTIKSEWGAANYPVAPGHEIVGIVTEVGSEVTKFHVGDRAAVGCMVDSCGKCRECEEGSEQYCRERATFTYNSPARDASEAGTFTQGGYTTQIVVRENFVLRFPEKLDLAAGAPLLCAGITTYSPLVHFGLNKPGLRIGVLGLGGLGHMAIKFAKAFGAVVTVISTSLHKREEALGVLGADRFVLSSDAAAMAAAELSLDAIVDTVAAQHDLNEYAKLLDLDGTLVIVGVPPEPLPLRTGSLVHKRRRLAGSLIGGIRETQEMLDFCAEHDITCQIELIGVDDVNVAMDRLVKNDVKYRFVLDIAKTLVASD